MWTEDPEGSPWVDMQVAAVRAGGSAKILRTRPRFPEWTLVADVFLNPGQMELKEFIRAAKTAGEMCGLGDYLAIYGRYSAEVEVLDEDDPA